MFSTRFAPVSKNRLTLLLEERSTAGSEVLDLTVSNPTRVNLQYPAETILASLISPSSLTYEPSPRGLDSARAAVSSYYAERGSQVATEDILLTASSSEAYSFLFKLLTEPGDRILVPAPSYPLFEYLVRSEALECCHYPLLYDGGWLVDLDRLGQLLSPSVKALLVVHPNNPTGSLIKPGEWEKLRELCSRCGLPVLCDEVFFDYRLAEVQAADLLAETEVPVFVLNGLSKISALPQMKLGWIAVRGPKAFRQESLDRLEILADTFLSVGTPIQHALPALLEIREELQAQVRERLRANLETLHSILAKSAASTLAVEAGWYAVVRLPSVISDEDWALRLLAEQDTLAHPGYFYEFPEPAFLVVSLLTSPRVFQEGVLRLRELVVRVCG